jgi:hypothetical protein
VALVQPTFFGTREVSITCGTLAIRKWEIIHCWSNIAIGLTAPGRVLSANLLGFYRQRSGLLLLLPFFGRFASQVQIIQRTGRSPHLMLRYVEVAGGGFQAAMPQQNLDGAQMGARFQQVSRKAVA